MRERQMRERPMHKRPIKDAGFTLLELMIVMAIIGVLAVVAIPKFTGAMKSAREAVLREDLHVMRMAIDSFTEDKQKGPSSLEDLITEGYLKVIPVDPITRSSSTWVTPPACPGVVARRYCTAPCGVTVTLGLSCTARATSTAGRLT